MGQIESRTGQGDSLPGDQPARPTGGDYNRVSIQLGNESVHLDGEADRLGSQLRGELIRRNDPGYDEARHVWNGMIDRRPLVIARCNGAADVMACVNFARDVGIPLSVRGGGHNVAGSAVCDDGIVIDLSKMRGVRVDPVARTVRVEGGATLGDVDHETLAFGLVVPSGLVPRTGIGGLALNGGMGFLTRKHGLTSDNLIAADVVTSDGRLMTANASENSELLWALKGGGGNFGVVTSLEFQAHPISPEVWTTVVMYPASMGVDVLRYFRDFMATASRDYMGLAVFWNSPSEHEIPEPARNRPVVVLVVCYTGPVEDGEEAVRPLRRIGEPLLDFSGRMTYAEAQNIFDPDYPDGRRYYWKSTWLNELNEEAMAALAGHAASRPSDISSIDIWALGGAMTDVGPDATAFARRDAPFLLGIEANWDSPDEDTANIAWARQMFTDMQRFSPGGAYLNFPGQLEEGASLLKQSYGINYERLVELKAKYDPFGLFPGTLGGPG